MKTLTVVIDEDSDECLYIDGKAWDSAGERTVYACDVAKAAGEEPFLFRHVLIDGHHLEWPDTLEAALAPANPQPIPPAKVS
jgi:hypothetical protein